ncbi:MAG: ribose 5-phosphate isomerase B [Candidatus Eisenbacteria bacterium]
MRIALGSDHAGFDLKERIRQHLETRAIEVKDFGTTGRESVDYPDFAFAVAEAVASGEYDYGMMVCSTGIGMSIAANKVKGIRAALVYNVDVAAQSRAHLDSNILVLGQKYMTPEEAIAAVASWLATPFEGGRHERRLQKIVAYEAKAAR